MINYIIAVSAIMFVAGTIVKGIHGLKVNADVGLSGGCGHNCGSCGGGCHVQVNILNEDISGK